MHKMKMVVNEIFCQFFFFFDIRKIGFVFHVVLKVNMLPPRRELK